VVQAKEKEKALRTDPLSYTMPRVRVRDRPQGVVGSVFHSVKDAFTLT